MTAEQKPQRLVEHPRMHKYFVSIKLPNFDFLFILDGLGVIRGFVWNIQVC